MPLAQVTQPVLPVLLSFYGSSLRRASYLLRHRLLRLYWHCYQLLALKLTATKVGSEAEIKSPWGGRPHYNSLMLESFDRASERSIGASLAYSLDQLGLQASALICGIPKALMPVIALVSHYLISKSWITRWIINLKIGYKDCGFAFDTRGLSEPVSKSETFD